MADDTRPGAAGEVLVLAPALLAATVLREVGPPARGDVRDDLASALVLLLGLALWVLARRLDLPRWAATVVVVLVPLCPPVASAAARGETLPLLAAVLLVGGLGLLVVRPAHPAGLVAAAVTVAAAAVLEPVLLVALAGPALALAVEGGRSAPDAAPRRAALIATGAAALGAGVRLAEVGGPATPDPLDVGLLATLLALLAVAGGLLLRRVRALATTGVALVVALALPGPVPAALAVVAAVVLLTLALAVADGFVRYAPTRLAGHDVRRPLLTAAVVAAVAAVVAVVPGWASRLVPAGTVAAAGPVASARPDATGASTPAPTPTAAPSVVATSPTPAPTVTPEASVTAQPPATTTAPTPTDTGSPVTPTTAPELPPAPAADALLARAGAQLAANPAVRLSGAARADLEAGRVDPRVLATLATVAGTQSVQVDAFPPADAADTGLLRAVRISALAGAPATRDAGATADLLAVLDAQSPEFHPLVDYERAAAVDGGPTVLLTFPREDA
ncbi:hypothetical protein [Arthrobacter sp. NEB 688]|uniref:hypothetical protein n=1 Tax=Arthrobacter sp. NEB 688 TaxID=904039 RepID=UPI0015667468|nr:hypothetical protein [Arthrobacter sp. NEB 688]QKE83577.1 hypothetical protein HL663_06225 [Arthrobacter sp. NEB 688]